MSIKSLLDFGTFRDHILDSVRGMGNTFSKPDDDWSPVLFLLSSTEKFYAIGLGEVMYDKDTKESLPQILLNLFEQYKPALASIVLSAWVALIKNDDPLKDLSFEMAEVYGVESVPHRKEAIMMEVASREVSESYMATISRFVDKPPTLGQWDKNSDGVSGRFGEILKATFSKVTRCQAH